jgi:AraC-like DNA-binding protein
MLFEAWDDAMRSTCGHFYAVPTDDRRTVEGHFFAQRLCGLDVANFACDVRSVDRTRQGIRLDDHEHLYLLVQLSGSTKIEQRDERFILVPGGLYLFDSTQPGRLVFDGAQAHCLSLHLPRAASLAEADSVKPLRVGEVVNVTKPAAQRIHSYILNAMYHGKSNAMAGPEYLLQLTQLAFASDHSAIVANNLLSQGSRFELAVREMEFFVARPEPTLSWLADRVGISTRQLERDFQAHQTSFVQLLREQRLKLACNLIELIKRNGREVSITDIAFASGFRDLSNFNRAFRTRFGMTPREYLRFSRYPVSRNGLPTNTLSSAVLPRCHEHQTPVSRRGV